MAGWTDEDTLKLLEFCGEDDIQAKLKGRVCNQIAYEKLAKEMVSAGFDKNETQFQDKIKKLTMEYKKVKDSNNSSGRERNT